MTEAGQATAIGLIAGGGQFPLLFAEAARARGRRVVAIANLSKELKNGDIRFEPIYRLDDQLPESQPSWVKVGDLRPRILAETSL